MNEIRDIKSFEKIFNVFSHYFIEIGAFDIKQLAGGGISLSFYNLGSSKRFNVYICPYTKEKFNLSVERNGTLYLDSEYGNIVNGEFISTYEQIKHIIDTMRNI